MTLDWRTGMYAGDERAAADRAAYDRCFPYYAELCALSELRKKPGLGVKVQSGMGGHSLLYLHGVCLDRSVGHPALRLSRPGDPATRIGVGISVNSHYRNANWVAAEGHDFIWQGALRPGEALSQAAYERTQAHAKAAGMLDGVQFHDHLFEDKPAGMSERDYMYEISVATDYAIRFGRDTYRTRVPLDRARMSIVIDYLNALNAPYRDGGRVYKWRLFNDNCAHVAHNALAAAGVWAPWPTGQFFLWAAFGFPVPKNELVDLALRTNDLPVRDARAMFEDVAARRALLDHGVLPTAAGGLCVAAPAVANNDVYETARLKLIFYDNPFWGPYRHRFKRMFGAPRFVDLGANLRHFAAVYALGPRPAVAAFGGAEGARFQACHGQYMAREAVRVREVLNMLDEPAMLPARAAS